MAVVVIVVVVVAVTARPQRLQRTGDGQPAGGQALQQERAATETVGIGFLFHGIPPPLPRSLPRE
jgi:hypothetical protein